MLSDSGTDVFVTCEIVSGGGNRFYCGYKATVNTFKLILVSVSGTSSCLLESDEFVRMNVIDICIRVYFGEFAHLTESGFVFDG